MKKNYAKARYAVRNRSDRNRQGYIKAIVTFFLLILFIGASIAQPEKADFKDQQPWKNKGYNTELVGKRTRTSKQFLNADNRISAFISPSSIHYLDEGNAWKDIDTRIYANSGNYAQTHPFVSKENAIQTWFPSDPFNNYIIMHSREGKFRERVSEIRILDANKNVLSSLLLNGSIVTTVKDNRIIYTGFHPALSLEYTLGNDGRKFDLIIHSASFLNTLPPGAQFISIQEEFISDAGHSRIETEDKEVMIYSEGIPVFKFATPCAFDSNMLQDDFQSGTLSVKLQDEKATLTTNFALAWIKNSARQFPVHLDPVVNYYPQFNTFWTGYQTSSASKTSGQIRVAGSGNQGWGKFDLATLPLGCTVTQAVYYGYHYSTTSTSKYCEIRGMGTVDPVSASSSAIYSQITSGNLYNGNYMYGGSTYSWNPGNLTGTALSDIATAAGNWIGLGFSYSSGSTTFMYHYGVNGTSTNICYLEVTYFTVPCSSTPGANSAVTPTYQICPGTSANIGLSATYSVGGITYQWQSSTTSSVGPFTSIPGATNASIPSPTLGTATWFCAVITCTNTASTITSTAAQVQVQSTTIDTIPYFESFEGLISENSLPNCSWSCSSLGSTALTYTASNTLGRVPRTGNNFASFYYNPTGSKYFYTNGLQLHAGITYSAALWFKTEYYGYNNWSDLSIMIGTSQSPTGLVTIASTGGPAISNVYKSLSDTFSVASSGIYYIAVVGTGGTSSSAQFLSWDDLEVTIPCSYNSPSLAVNASTSSICSGDMVNITASGADTYLWSTGATGNAISVTPPVSTTYSVTGTNTLSACSVNLAQYITVNPSPVVYVYADNSTVCVGSPVILTAFGNGGTYQWSTGGTGPVITANPGSLTIYSVIATNSLGCSSQASQQVAVFPLPGVQVSSSMPNDMCAGETATLSASGALTYQWTSNLTSFIYSGSSINISPSATAMYSVVGTDNHNCSAVTTIIQNVNECTALTEITSSTGFLNIYPIPAEKDIYIRFNSTDERSIELMDVTGRVILSERSQSDVVTVNVIDLAAGIYYVRVSSNGKTNTLKVLKK